jgi:hypothetical protein
VPLLDIQIPVAVHAQSTTAELDELAICLRHYGDRDISNCGQTDGLEVFMRVSAAF